MKFSHAAYFATSRPISRDDLHYLRYIDLMSRRIYDTAMRLNLIARFAAHTRFCRLLYGCRNRERIAETTHYGVKILKFNATRCNLGLRFVLRAQRADFAPLILNAYSRLLYLNLRFSLRSLAQTDCKILKRAPRDKPD